MKSLNSFSVLGVVLTLIFFLFAGLECKDSENDPPEPVEPEPEKCGEKVSDRKWFVDFTTEGLKEISTFDETNRVATFSFSAQGQEDVCPYEHVKVKIQIIGYTGANFTRYGFNVDILYGIFFSYKLTSEHFTITHDANYTYFDAVADFGLSPSAGDGPGWYSPFLDIHIINKEDIDDAVYDFEHAIYMIKIDWEHRKYKEPES